MKIRAFLALPLDDTARDALAWRAEALRGLDKKGEIRWTPAENYHLTVAFLGDILHADVPRLEQAVAAQLADQAPFTAHARETSFFPFNARPRLVLALFAVDEAILRLHRRVIAAVRQAGMPVEKRAFTPHVTLGRVRRRGVPWLHLQPEPLDVGLPVDRVNLYRSDRDREGSRYRAVFSAGLSGDSV